MFDVLFEVDTWLLNSFFLAEIVEVCFVPTKASVLRLSRVRNLHSMDIWAFVWTITSKYLIFCGSIAANYSSFLCRKVAYCYSK